MDFGFAALYIRNKDLKIQFDRSFSSSLNKPNFENKVKFGFRL